MIRAPTLITAAVSACGISKQDSLICICVMIFGAEVKECTAMVHCAHELGGRRLNTKIEPGNAGEMREIQPRTHGSPARAGQWRRIIVTIEIAIEAQPVSKSGKPVGKIES